MTYREAVREAIREALATDERVFFMGEDVGRYGGAFAVSHGLLEEFGPERVRDAPLSESAFVGAGIGAAIAGLRPIVEVMTINFSLLALDQVVNNAATIRYMSGGQFGVPLVVRMATGGGRQLAAQHAHSLEAWYAHVPGIKALAPATVADARWMLPAALADPDPVFLFEHATLYPLEGEVDEEARPRRAGQRGGAARRAGTSRWSPTAARWGSAWTPPSGSRRRASRPRSSTCAPCGRSTSTPCSPPSPGPTGSSSSTRAGGASGSSRR